MRKFYFLLLSVLFAAVTSAQVSNYTFSQSNGTYTPITGGTVIVTATDPSPSGNDSASIDDFTYAEYALPFPMNVGNQMQTTFRVNSNGWVGFGSGSNTSTPSPISSTIPFNAIVSAFAADLMGLSSATGTVTNGSNTITGVSNTAFARIGALITGTGIPAGTTITGFTGNTITLSANATSTTATAFLSWTTGEIRVETLGTAPNRTFVIQWSGMSRFSSGTTSGGLNSQANFQIRLFEGGGNPANQTISVIYGPNQHPGTSGTTVQVGLRGATNTDFNNRTSTTDWSATTAGATNSASVTWSNTVFPPNGLTFTWTPPAACVTPPDQPTALNLTPGAGNVSGTFTPAASAPTGYLVVMTPTSTPPATPVNGTTYTPGSSALGGTIVSSGPATTFNQTGLSPATPYYFWVYSFNNTACTAGPVYNNTAPLAANSTTLACTITGTRTVGPGGTYATLTAAIADLTTNGVAGPVVLELLPTYTSASETFPITIPFIPCISATNNVTIRPQTGASGLVITSANAIATIDLNGANYINIDGRPGGTGTTSQLTISNTATGTASTVRFINDASNNSVRYTTLQGSSSTTNGVVLFSTGVVTGNDNNTIANNTIGAAGANLPLNGVVSLGSSATIDNSGNTVNANDIADVFSAASVFSGINVGSNNNAWTITNNRVYQTASRAVTTSNTNRGIAVTAGNGHTISNNTIGFANAAGTGVTAYTSTVAARYIGIQGTFEAGAPINNIQNNTIAGMTMTTTSTTSSANGVWAGINVTAGDVNIQGNTIGATTGTGSVVITPTSTGGLLVGINAAGSTGNVTIQNNSIGALTNSGTTATVSGAVTGIASSGSLDALTITNNAIGNTTPDNMRAGTFGLTTATTTVRGINIDTSPDEVTITNNTIRNLSSYSTSTTSTGGVRGIETTTSSSAPFIITGNTIHNLTTNSASTSISNGVGSAIGIAFGDGVNGLISQNVIHTISNINATAIGSYVVGITHNNAANTTISRNRIYNLMNAGTSTSVTAPSIAAGILIRDGTAGSPINIVNNMISLGNSQTTNTAFIGIQLNHGETTNPVDNIWFNSINIEGTVASGAQPSFGIARTDFTTTARTAQVDIKNNLITNTRSGGTGGHYAIANNYGATASTTGWGPNASNYNVLNAAPSTVGWWNGAQTFPGWQAASQGDANSLSGVPINYVNPATADLHIAGTPTPIEGTGTPIPFVTEDFDGENRAMLTPTDIGADAGNFFNYPAITYSVPATTCAPGATTLTATITDPDGVPTSGPGLPVLYWRINAGPYQAATATFMGGNQYQFNFGSGSVVGDVISYYIVAQDNLGNVGSYPSPGAGGFTTNPPAAATPPTNPSTITILQTLSGTYTVGTTGNYPTLTAAVNAYNMHCLGGPVTFSLIDPTYPSETFPISINANPMASSTNTLTIKPAVQTTITGSSPTAIILLNGADYVTINGSISNTPNSVCPPSAATRDLTISNTNTGTATAVIWLGNASNGDPVTNASVINTVVIGGGATTTVAGIGSGGSTIGTSSLGTDNDNLSFINNDIRAARFGIYSSGASATNKNQNLVINQNFINNPAPNNVGETGIYVGFTNNVAVTGNTVGNIMSTGVDAVGINAGMSSVSGISATTTGAADGVSNVFIANNTIGAVSNSATNSAAGIALGNTASGTSLLANNMISGVAANGTLGDFAGGIVLGGGTALVNVYHNTVAMQGTIPGSTAATQISTALAVTSSTASPLDIRNNILSNTQAGNAGATLRLTAIGFRFGPPFTGVISNNNDLFSAGPGPGTYAIGTTGSLTTGTLYTTLAAWQAGTGLDAASQNVLPVFVSPTDLHLVNTVGTNWCLNGAGASIPLITQDIDCEVRGNPPDIGADEFTATSDAVATPASQTICSGAPINTIVFSGSPTSFTWVRNNVTGVTGIPATGTGNISGNLTNTTNAPLTVTFDVTPIMGGCPGPRFTATVLVNPTPDAVATPPSQTICSGATITPITVSGAVTGTTFNWTRDNTAQVTGIPASGSGDVTGALTNTTNAPVTVTFTFTPTANSCPGTPVTATVLVNPTPNAVATPSSQSTCSGDPITTIVITGGVSGTTFNWTRDNVTQATGIPASGSGDISGSLTNTTNAPVTVTFNITPTANGCTGTPTTATVTVNPIPNAVATPPSQSVCSGAAITPITLTGNVGGTTFNWTRDNTAQVTGIPPSGSGNVSGTLTNNTGSPVTVTFTFTPTANGCTGTPVTSTVTVNPQPVIASTVTEPTTCVSTDGSINLTLSGATSYTFAWTGSGVNPTSEDQTGLTVGIYTVVVTANGGCTATATFNLVGPGGCAVCPTIGSVATTPSGATCQNQPTTITASGLQDMGVTYGIQFKHSTTALADPYVGGTNIATVPNSGLTGGGTSASTTTSFATPGSYFIYAILSPVPSDPNCRPSAVINLQVNPIPDAVATPSSQVSCSGTPITTIVISGAVSGTTFTWTRDNSVSLTGIPASGSGNISGTLTNTTTAPVTTTFTITPTANGCPGPATTATVTVNPTPTVNAVGNQTVCNGASTAAVTFTGTVPGTVFNWTNNTTSIGLGANGSGNIASFTATNTGSAPVTATITVTPTYTNGGTTCTGTPTTFNITVNPTPTTNAVANQAVCAGSSTTAINFAGPVTGTTFTWTNSNTAIGLGANGTGNIPAFTATNAGTTPISGTITVTPSYTNGGTTCTGPTSTFSITVNPTPTVNTVSNQTVCNGSPTTAVTFSGAVPGTVFNWTNNTTSIGLAASGTGNIASFNAVNTGSTPVTATVTVTPTYTNAGVTCTGIPTTFTITVNPTPTVNTVPNQTLCNGASTAAVNFTGSVPGTVFNWTNNNTSIGLGASGTGNIPSFTAVNTGTTPVVATVTVTPSSTVGGVTCTGTPTTFTITVNPAPTVNPVTDQTVCAGTSTTAITFSSPIPGTTFTWTNNNTAIGLPATGSGNIPAFTATNTGTAPITAIISVNPIGAGGACVGAPRVFRITVNPRPSATAVTNQVVCAGSATTAVTLAGPVPNTVFTWTNSNPAIGLPASGTGNIPSFVAINTGITPVTSTVTVTPSFTAGGVTCTGTAITFTYTVNPRPVVTATPLANRICLSDDLIALSGSPVGGSWSGIGVSGFNFVPSATAVGTYTLTYSVVSAQGCIGTATVVARVESCPERIRLLADDAVILYPNPNNGMFSIRINSTAYNYLGMKVYNMLGQQVKAPAIFGGLTFGRVIPIDLSYLPAGTYIVKFYNDASGPRTSEKAFKVVIAGH